MLQERLETGDAETCAQVLSLADACDAPAMLAPRADAAAECCRRRPILVAERCEAHGLANVAEAIKALTETDATEQDELPAQGEAAAEAA